MVKARLPGKTKTLSPTNIRGKKVRIKRTKSKTNGRFTFAFLFGGNRKTVRARNKKEAIRKFRQAMNFEFFSGFN